MVVSSPAFFAKARACLIDSPHVTSPSDIPERPLPAHELEAHYNELLAEFLPYRTGLVPFVANGYRGPWIENYWVDKFCCNRNLSAFGMLVPLFICWSDITVRWGNRNFTIVAQAIYKRLRPDVLYVTVVQSDSGMYSAKFAQFNNFTATRNILVLSAGGTGHVPIPLLQREMAQGGQPQWFAYNMSFSGWLATSRVRPTMVNAMIKAAAENTSGGGKVVVYNDVVGGIAPPSNDTSVFRMACNRNGVKWKDFMRATVLNTAPRGYGRTSCAFAPAWRAADRLCRPLV